MGAISFPPHLLPPLLPLLTKWDPSRGREGEETRKVMPKNSLIKTSPLEERG